MKKGMRMKPTPVNSDLVKKSRTLKMLNTRYEKALRRFLNKAYDLDFIAATHWEKEDWVEFKLGRIKRGKTP